MTLPYYMARFRRSESPIVFAQARPLLIKTHGGWDCFVGRDVIRNAEQEFNRKK